MSSVDCLEWGAVLLSTEVQDTDRDGIVDIVEDQSGGVTDPNGQQLPDLHAMGASSTVKDLFVEIGFMQTTALDNPWPVGSGVDPHSHLPTYAALKMIGDAYKNAPVDPISGPGPQQYRGIKVHFDVGNLYQDHLADGYVIP